jgi:hypothetical protein
LVLKSAIGHQLTLSGLKNVTIWLAKDQKVTMPKELERQVRLE